MMRCKRAWWHDRDDSNISTSICARGRCRVARVLIYDIWWWWYDSDDVGVGMSMRARAAPGCVRVSSVMMLRAGRYVWTIRCAGRLCVYGYTDDDDNVFWWWWCVKYVAHFLSIDDILTRMCSSCSFLMILINQNACCCCHIWYSCSQ